VAYNTPGVYREEVFLRPGAAVPTGVPGFIGFGQTPDGAPALLNRAEDLAFQFTPAGAPGACLADAVNGFFANGGTRCRVVGAPYDADPATAADHLIGALATLGPLDDVDLVAAPDAMALAAQDAASAQRVQRALLDHCAQHGDRFAILDARPGQDPAVSVPQLVDWRRQLAAGSSNPANGAIYYPWLLVPAGDGAPARAVPPCGHVAGIYARSDRKAGVFKAPANEELLGLQDLEFQVDATAQASLNPEGINCLRAFPGRGLRVWGARTLSADATWRYVSVRRLFLALSRWIDRNMAWASFEPNDVRLWNRIVRELDTCLNSLLAQGALKGTSNADAYFIKCDAETNPPEERALGRVTTLLGFAPVVPGEFVVVRIQQRDGGTRLSP